MLFCSGPSFLVQGGRGSRVDPERLRRRIERALRVVPLHADAREVDPGLRPRGVAGKARRQRALGPFEVPVLPAGQAEQVGGRSEEHTYELQSLMRISYAVFCLEK